MWPKKPKKNPLAPSKKPKKMDADILGEITRPSSASSTLKIGSPTIRVGLDAASGKQPKPIKVPQVKINKMAGPKPPKM